METRQRKHRRPDEPRALALHVGLQRRVLPRPRTPPEHPSPALTRSAGRDPEHDRARAAGFGGRRGASTPLAVEPARGPARSGAARSERERRVLGRPLRPERGSGSNAEGRRATSGAGATVGHGRPSGRGRRRPARRRRQPGTCAAEQWTAQPHRAEAVVVARSYGDTEAPPEAKTLTPCVGLQRWVTPPTAADVNRLRTGGRCRKTGPSACHREDTSPDQRPLPRA